MDIVNELTKKKKNWQIIAHYYSYSFLKNICENATRDSSKNLPRLARLGTFSVM